VGVAVALNYFFNNLSYKEISWKEFYAEFLEKNDVERLEVHNNSWVGVVTKQQSPVSDGIHLQYIYFSFSSLQYKYFFNIGSVESFERSLAVAQLHLGLEPDRQIPVLYKSEGNLFVSKFVVFSLKLFSFRIQALPSLLNMAITLGFLYYFYRMFRGGGPAGQNRR
jgi:hypothetical protein